QHRAADEAEWPSERHKQVGEGADAERGERPLARVGGRDTQTRRHADTPPGTQGAPDDQQRDGADSGGDGQTQDEAPTEELEFHGYLPLEAGRQQRGTPPAMLRAFP